VADMCDISLTVGGCLMCIFISRKWGIHNMDKELASGNDLYMTSIWRTYLHFAIKYLCPVLLSIISVLVIVEKFVGLENIL
jgi:NSS family neurotransmitter:Na+ symporter